MKQRRRAKETVDKYFNFFTEANNILRDGGEVKVGEMITKHKVFRGAFHLAVQMGYFLKSERGNYDSAHKNISKDMVRAFLNTRVERSRTAKEIIETKLRDEIKKLETENRTLSVQKGVVEQNLSDRQRQLEHAILAKDELGKQLSATIKEFNVVTEIGNKLQHKLAQWETRRWWQRKPRYFRDAN